MEPDFNRAEKIKIQYQAWLVNGQPVAAGNDAVIVTFSSAIHCDKTMEPELKGVVERVMSTVLGRPLQLLSVMEEEWQGIDQQAAAQKTARPQSRKIRFWQKRSSL